MNRDIVDQGAGDFVVERRGAHVVVRRIGEADAGRGPIGWPEAVDGHVFVLVSPDAAKDASLTTALPGLLHRFVVAQEVKAVRIALPGFGRDPFLPQALADALKIEVHVPDGSFVVAPGAFLYAGHGTGGTGWLRFGPGVPACLGGKRYPVPVWEAALPDNPVAMAHAVVEPIPAGLLVRRPEGRPAAPGDEAFSVPADAAAVSIVVGAQDIAPDVGAVSTVVVRLASIRTRLVSLSTVTSAHAWLSELVKSLGRNVTVTVSPREAEKRYRPFVVKLLQRVDGTQEVSEAAAPPKGWQQSEALRYRRGRVLADVVPSGLVLRTGAGDPSASVPPFDPEGWTLYLGTAGELIGPDLLSAAEALLGELAPEIRRVARLRLLGVLDEKTRELIDRRPAIATRPVPAAEPEQRPETPIAPSSPAISQPAPAIPVAEVARPQGGPVMPSALMVSSAPVPTVSGSASALPQQEPVAEAPPAPVEAEPPALAELSGTASEKLGDTVPAGESPLNHEPAESGGAPEPAGPATPRPAPGSALVVADRASTAAEQSRFAAAAGDVYGEALASVNAALATWPSMRGQADAAVKADYVAICLYLGRGRGGFDDLNTAVRGGAAGEIDGQVHCLASGLRRLPTHRRPVLRQGKDALGLERAIEPGSILTEPGFLVGSMDLDVTLAEADLDVLIWPATARRTSELLIGQPVNEVVFFAGARFKALALREAEAIGDEPEDELTAPRLAALFRELAPGEEVSAPGELDDQDLAVLAKLDRALERRRRGALRVIEERDLMNRMTSSLQEWHEEVSAPAGRTFTLAS
ncbi:hypothetical protein SD37_09620 [Amycolatopsis orientalis]|uniref:Uncharacterized protein n=1 Tax=Amycolatopsis orientalis TaxID=31958 RepID=A0A193CAM4_AMYOR|nr:hypothetical protein [Amycolatopsis orientalis]ANN21671.1 hypothetical protein SD37_09620 [Amycolatopsis orientalis]